MEKSIPEVTVIIPTWDRSWLLEQAARDALRQTNVRLELLIVDDGSSDPEAIKHISELDPRVRVIRHDRRRGVACARNTGIENAGGMWLAFLDDDDRWAPTKLRTQLDAAAAADAPWVFAGALTIDQRDRVLFAEQARLPSTAEWVATVNPVPGGCSNVVARAELVRTAGGFDEQLSLLADWDLWIRLAAMATPAVCPEVLLAYRLHPDNMHLRDIETMDAELEHLARKHRGAHHELRRDLHVWPALPWRAKAYRRSGRRTRAASLFLQRWRLTRDHRDLIQALISLAGEPIVSAVRRYWTRGRVSRPDWLDDRAYASPTDGRSDPPSVVRDRGATIRA